MALIEKSIPPRGFLRRHWRRLTIVAALLFVTFVGPWWHSWIPEGIKQSPPTISDASEKSPEGPLQAGVAVTEVTDLALGRPLAGYGERAFTPVSEVADPIFTRAIVLDNSHRRVAIVTADILLFNRALAGAVMNALTRLDPKWKRENVFFGATHTHSGPCGFAGLLAEQVALGLYDSALLNDLAERVAKTIHEASQNLVPSEFSYAAIDVDRAYIENRTNGEDRANRWLDAVQFRESGSSKPLASIVIFNAHATCRKSDDMRISADYPGEVVRRIEAELGGKCLFLAGSVGSMKPSAPVSREQWVEVLGKALSDYAQQSLRESSTFDSEVELAATGYFIPLPTPAVKVTENLRLSPLLAGTLLHEDAWLHGLRIGKLILLGTPADYSGVLAEDLRKTFPDCTTVVTSFNGDYCGYILPDSYYDLPKYEPRQMAFFGRHCGSFFQYELTRLALLLRSICNENKKNPL